MRLVIKSHPRLLVQVYDKFWVLDSNISLLDANKLCFSQVVKGGHLLRLYHILNHVSLIYMTCHVFPSFGCAFVSDQPLSGLKLASLDALIYVIRQLELQKEERK